MGSNANAVVSNGQTDFPQGTVSDLPPVLPDATELAADANVVLEIAGHTAEMDGLDGSAANGHVEYGEYLRWKSAQPGGVQGLYDSSLAAAAKLGYLGDYVSAADLDQGILSDAFGYALTRALGPALVPTADDGTAMLSRATLESMANMDPFNPADPFAAKFKDGALLPMTFDAMRLQARALLARIDVESPGYFSEASPMASLMNLRDALGGPAPIAPVDMSWQGVTDPAARERAIESGIRDALYNLIPFSDTASIAEHNVDPAANRDNELFGENGLYQLAGLQIDSGVFVEPGTYDGGQFIGAANDPEMPVEAYRERAIAAAQFLTQPEVLQVLKAHAAEWGLEANGNLLFSPDAMRIARDRISGAWFSNSLAA